MSVQVSPSPNPNAMKFSVGRSVGGPVTYTGANLPEAGFAAELLAIEGVVGIFMTADFVTITKSPGADWDAIVPPALAILESEFGDS